MHALLNEMNMNESHEKEYVEVGVDKHLLTIQEDRCYHSRSDGRASEHRHSKRWVITRFLDGLMPHPRRDMRAIGSDYFEATTFWAIEDIMTPLGIEEDIMTPLGVEYSVIMVAS
jgi:hypothetical protein